MAFKAAAACDVLNAKVLMLSPGAKVGKLMASASSAGAHAAILVGEEEVARGRVSVKNLGTGEQTEVAFPWPLQASGGDSRNELVAALEECRAQTLG